MEYLKFNQGGQWELVQKSNPFTGYEDMDFMSYRPLHLQGSLPKDIGTKGMLHNTANRRSKPQISHHRMRVKVPTPVSSGYDDRNPGVGA